MAVRREVVQLALEDRFTKEMLAAAAATKLLERNLKGLDGTAVGAGDSLDDTAKSTRAMTLEQAIADEKAKRLRTTLRDQARASVNAEEGIQGVTGRTRAFTLEQVIADERASRLKATLREQARAALDAEDGLDAAAAAAGRFAVANDRSGSSIDRYSGRLGIMLQTATLLGPTIAPIGAAATAGVAALAAQAGFAAVGIGSIIVAFQGVGDAVQAANKAAIEPTRENLQAARDAMAQLGPDAQEFVRRLSELRPVLHEIRDSAAAGFFPGLTESLDSFERVAPAVSRLFEEVGRAAGSLVDDAAKSLAGPEWREFISFLTREAPPAIEALGHSVGNLTLGMAELWQAFTPTTTGFTMWLEDASRDFRNWAADLGRTQGFQEFLAYIDQTGPKVAEALGAVANAALQIAEAAAPLGGPTLDAITGIANGIALIANSPFGPAIAATATALSASSLAVRGYDAAVKALGGSAEATAGSLSKLGPAVSLVALATAIPQVQKGLDELLGSYDIVNETDLGRDLSTLLNTGDAVGEIQNLDSWLSILDDNLSQVTATAFGWVPFDDPSLTQAEDSLKKIDTQLAQMVESGRGEDAAKIFEIIKSRADELGTSANQLPQIFTEYNQAVDNAASASESAASSIRHIGTVAEYTKQEIRGLTDAMLDQKDAALSAFDAETAYREALKAAGKQADRNNAGIKGSTKGALANREALGQLAAAWNNQSAQVRNNVDRFREARRAFIQTAEAMGVPTAAAKRLADRILNIPRSWVTKIALDGVQSATDTIRQYMQELSNIPRNIPTTVTVTRVGDIPSGPVNSPPGGGNPLTDPVGGDANGGTVPGLRYPYGDKVLRWLAPGEEVISNRHGQADRHRDLLKAINADRLARGGTVTRASERPTWVQHRGSERPVSSSSNGTSTVRHLIEVKVVGGEIDLTKARAQIAGVAREVSQDEIAQDRSWRETQR